MRTTAPITSDVISPFTLDVPHTDLTYLRTETLLNGWVQYTAVIDGLDRSDAVVCVTQQG